MMPFEALHGGGHNRTVKGDKTALMPDGEGQEIQVGDLVWTMDTGGICDASVQKTDVIRPKLMQGTRCCFGQTFPDPGDGNRVWIVRMGHDAHATVLC